MKYLKGKGAQHNVPNRFSKQSLDTSDLDGIDEEAMVSAPRTQVFYEYPKKIISYNESPDIRLEASVNPYQGCEHGCIYCYARNSHEYWGFSAGLDFESKIIVKPDAPKLLEQAFLKKSYEPKALMLSGNTDCYQPLEKKYRITRQLLEVCLKYQHPVNIITKNALVTRDIDILQSLAEKQLTCVVFSITTQDEGLRRIMEPRTASAAKKFEAMALLTEHRIPTGVMNAPVIPSLNHHEMPAILKKAAEAGAGFAGYTAVRLNGQIARLFRDWLEKNFPDRAEKVWHQIQALHGGNVNDSEFGRRITGTGEEAAMIARLYEVSKRKYFKDRKPEPLDLSKFRRGGNYQLF